MNIDKRNYLITILLLGQPSLQWACQKWLGDTQAKILGHKFKRPGVAGAVSQLERVHPLVTDPPRSNDTTFQDPRPSQPLKLPELLNQSLRHSITPTFP